MKVIDLLNKIANGEKVPKKIKYVWVYEWALDNLRGSYGYLKEADLQDGINSRRFDSEWLIANMLNEEVEIIDDELVESLKGGER